MEEHNFCSLTLQLESFSLEQRLPCNSLTWACPHSLPEDIQCLFIRCFFNSSSGIKCYTYFLWWSEFSTPFIAPSLQVRFWSFPCSQVPSSFNVILNVFSQCLFLQILNVWPERLNGICKTVLTQGNSLIIIIIISIPVTGKTDPRVTAPFYLTHTQNIQPKDHPWFKEFATCAHWNTVKMSSEKLLCSSWHRGRCPVDQDIRIQVFSQLNFLYVF